MLWYDYKLSHKVTETILNFHMALDFKFEYDLLAPQFPASRARGILKVIVKWWHTALKPQVLGLEKGSSINRMWNGVFNELLYFQTQTSVQFYQMSLTMCLIDGYLWKMRKLSRAYVECLRNTPCPQFLYFPIVTDRWKVTFKLWFLILNCFEYGELHLFSSS